MDEDVARGMNCLRAREHDPSYRYNFLGFFLVPTSAISSLFSTDRNENKTNGQNARDM